MPQQPRQTRGFSLGTLVGARIIVQPSTLVMLVILAAIFASGSGTLNSRTFILGLSLAVILFASVFLHEASHALAARAFGRRVDEIVLTLWGGHTSFDARDITPKVAAVTALAGPAANLVIGVVIYVLSDAGVLGGLPGQILAWAGYANLLLAAFNILPGVPMDGGHVLEAVVWALTGRRHTGLKVAAWGGRVIAAGVVLWAVAVPLLNGRTPDTFSIVWSLLLASILWPAASAALRHSQTVGRRVGVSAVTLMDAAVGVPFDVTVADVVATARSVGANEAVVLAADGVPAGHITMDVALSVPEERRASTGLQAVTTPLPRGAVVQATDDAEDLVGHLREWWGRTDVWVVSSDGEPVGVLRLLDAMNALR
ncbi:M50 family metallopeptidase [Demequina zhanjiangensis]|uniref:Zinc metalloprotease n=1 Tax=Demequina zhanjiangensis TaxID=3051659 RepID=A0ABT8G1W5_9MICO|nr:M50 family metallopeptidase [Demequina sp. SYSU T00b26]MDN4473125.1 M50 family metallopeptidase [Demequina sp. SYSU T00b26]